MLGDFPVIFGAPEVKQALTLFASIHRVGDIETVVGDAGLSLAEIEWHAKPSLTWRSIYETAAGKGLVDELINAICAQRPALKPTLEEIRSVPSNLVVDQSPKSLTEVKEFSSPAWKNFSGDGTEEAIIVAGQPTFVEVSFLLQGLVKSRSVCRLSTRFPGKGFGTAFRVGPTTLLTNYHVVFNKDQGYSKAQSIKAWFNYESDTLGKPSKVVKINCDVESIVGEHDDDWAIVRALDEIPSAFPPLDLSAISVPEIDDRVNIIQHPGGGPKKFAMQHNLVRAVDDRVIQYWTDTDLGSSGAPVFDDDWNLVALHHYSLPAPPGDRIDVRNQGRRIDRVIGRMSAAGLSVKDLA